MTDAPPPETPESPAPDAPRGLWAWLRRQRRKLLALGVAGLLFAGWWVWWWHYSNSLFSLEARVEAGFGTFTLGPECPIPRTEAGGAVCAGKFYLVGGLGGFAGSKRNCMVYDPADESWESIADLPQPIHHPGVTSANGKLYVLGGFKPLGLRPHGAMLARWNPLATAYEFDPARGTWRTLAEMPGPRGAGGVCAAAGALWYVGGINPARVVAPELYRFDLASETWSTLPPMRHARDHMRMEAVDGALYAISGREDDMRFNLDVLERFDIASETWTEVAPIPLARGGLATAVLDGKIYCFGGEFLWTCGETVERYDPRTDRWETLGLLPEARHGICAGTIDGRIHLISGGRHPRISVSGIHRIFVPNESP